MVAAVFLVLAGLISGCQHKNQLDGLTLTVAQHSSTDNMAYFDVRRMADVWASGLPTSRPILITTKDFTDNVTRLRAGAVDVALATADIATEAAESKQPGQRNLRALTWMHSYYVELTALEYSPARTLTDLLGRQVTVNVANPELELLASRLLEAAGIDAERKHLTMGDGMRALTTASIDARFFGSTDPDGLFGQRPGGLRSLDLSGVLPALRARYPAYTRAASSGSFVMVPVLLLVTDAMPDSVAEALTRTLLESRNLDNVMNQGNTRPGLARDTMPIPLHPGAQKYYRSIN
ncbi:TAXI family TRAP transporter solute-binding subunit [Amycolatopsis anabasis]|uniref:TAXI family TRAP transporter solute-binding subunit n=1 Tax=Amycolatopsis anabasis TaxID=1840409 RepID=UPI00131D3D26|nr:TAXI family TRAP transporter solute-binding subunit [Amycolatopsis anabasis]